PWARAADNAPSLPPALRLVTFDIGVDNDRFDDIANFILDAGPDMVLLQGVSCTADQRLIPKLKPTFATALVSATGCDGQALLSTRAGLAGGQVTTAARKPLMVWARFQWGGRAFVLSGVHLAGPLTPYEQAAEVQRVVSQLDQQGASHILAGN